MNGPLVYVAKREPEHRLAGLIIFVHIFPGNTTATTPRRAAVRRGAVRAGVPTGSVRPDPPRGDPRTSSSQGFPLVSRQPTRSWPLKTPRTGTAVGGNQEGKSVEGPGIQMNTVRTNHIWPKGFSSLTEFYCQFQIQQMHNNKTLGFCFDLCKFRRALTSGADIP